VIVGGGIVGLATARFLLESRPGLSLTLLEKEPRLATHQTGHNSGVLHSGIYYPPGSLKARYAKQGTAALYELCAAEGIPVERCGKVIVATTAEELPRLDALEKRASEHGIEAVRLDSAGLREREPNATGLAALLVPSTGIVDYAAVSDSYARAAVERGADLRTSAEVIALRERADRVEVVLADGAVVPTRLLLNCAGLQSDRIARLAGVEPAVRILPFRGEYFELTPERRSLVRHLIYPVPDPAFPFLGVHFTRDVHGGVHAGPNAVLAPAREGYGRWQVSGRDLRDVVTFPGFWRLARRYWRTGAGEYHRSLSKRAFVAGLQRLVPDVQAEDLVEAAPGIRAQAVRSDGTLVDDFLIQEAEHSVHVLNAPSPAATASPLIGRHLAGLVSQRLG
jgi:L-2-hydroxyglutarate oxidase